MVSPDHGNRLAHELANLVARHRDIVHVDELAHTHNSDQTAERPIEQRNKEDGLFIRLVELKAICVCLLYRGYVSV